MGHLQGDHDPLHLGRRVRSHPQLLLYGSAVKAKAKVMTGTTRHLDIVKWAINNVIATEPHFPLWIGYANNELPTAIGKLLTGHDYGGDAKKCMDEVAKIIDAKTKDAGLF